MSSNSRCAICQERSRDLRSDVTDLKIDVGSLKTDVADLKTGQARLEQGLGEVKSGLSDLATTVMRHDAEIIKLWTSPRPHPPKTRSPRR